MRSHASKLSARSVRVEPLTRPGLHACSPTLRSCEAAPAVADDWEIHGVAGYDPELGPVMRFELKRGGVRRPSGYGDGLFANIAAAQAAIPKRKQ